MKFIIAFLLILAVTSTMAQTPLRGSGTRFVFALPEGPDRISPGSDTSRIYLRIMSPYSGTGTVTAQGGIIQKNFQFTPNIVTVVELPNSVVMKAASKSIENKGIIVTTTQPVNLILHRFMEFAGDATQIYPEEELGKDYVVTSWGIYNDVGEDNLTQFTVTALYPETVVEVTPSIAPPGEQPWQPFTVVMGTGETLIVKGDISTASNVAGFCGSRIHASAAVSVTTNVTCGYVPLGIEACNEMLDEILPKKDFGQTFYASPLSDSTMPCRLIFVSDSMNFNVLSGRGLYKETTTGRIEMSLSAPDVFGVSVPAQCHLITSGSDLGNISDPSLVTVLPPDLYNDTLLWYTPNVSAGGNDFFHYITIVFPSSRISDVLLDGMSVNSYKLPNAIPQSNMSAIQIPILPGVHKITSPVGVYAVASGFQLADAYTFIPMGVAAQKSGVNARESSAKSDGRINLTANPIHDVLAFRLSQDVKPERIVLYDMLGGVVKELGRPFTAEMAISARDIASGSYILAVFTQAEVIKVPLTVIH
jgi:hypothetical protein